MESYIEFNVICDETVREGLIAELGEEDYEGFIENENGFSAYILSSNFKSEVFDSLLKKYGVNPAAVPRSIIEQQNWNEQWEAGYEPIIIDDIIAVLAPFHRLNITYPIELTIKPKNTFGTGHHETTQLMLKLMKNAELKDKTVFDYGCGTGVLGVMASKMGARSVYAIDIDEWSVENVSENAELNNVANLIFEWGDLSVVPNVKFDVIVANINKNILLESFERLAELLDSKGQLFISGFYETDIPDLTAGANESNLTIEKTISLNQWSAAIITHKL